jgi:hypothetical protein
MEESLVLYQGLDDHRELVGLGESTQFQAKGLDRGVVSFTQVHNTDEDVNQRLVGMVTELMLEF